MGLPLADAGQNFWKRCPPRGIPGRPVGARRMGRQFMHSIAVYPDAYDRVDRLSRMPHGQQTVPRPDPRSRRLQDDSIHDDHPWRRRTGQAAFQLADRQTVQRSHGSHLYRFAVIGTAATELSAGLESGGRKTRANQDRQMIRQGGRAANQNELPLDWLHSAPVGR